MDNATAIRQLLSMNCGVSYIAQPNDDKAFTCEIFPLTQGKDEDKLSWTKSGVQQEEIFPFIAGDNEYRAMAQNKAVKRFLELAFPARTR